MALVTGPVHGRVLADLLGVLRLNEGIATLVILTGQFLSALQVLLLVNVAGVGVIFDEQADDVLIAVTTGPEQRVPAILLGAGVRLLQEKLLYLLKVIVLDGLDEQGVALLLRHVISLFGTVV